jgi:hypothetical protein
MAHIVTRPRQTEKKVLIIVRGAYILPDHCPVADLGFTALGSANRLSCVT